MLVQNGEEAKGRNMLLCSAFSKNSWRLGASLKLGALAG
jgi:hypothetical protein